MECKREGCETVVSGNQVYCSSACKQACYRNKTKPEAVTDVTVTEPSVTAVDVTLIENFGESDCQCQMCKTNRVNGNRHIINHGVWKPACELGRNELNFTTLPGDPDYTSKCKATANYDTGVSQVRLQEA